MSMRKLGIKVKFTDGLKPPRNRENLVAKLADPRPGRLVDWICF
jgi:hypothetical protein